MKNRLNRRIKSFFTFSKSEQRGIALLLLLIFLILLINVALPYFLPQTGNDFSAFKADVEIFLKEKKRVEDSLLIDRLQNSGAIDEALARRKLKPFPFDPNKLPEEKWLELGLTRKQAERILKYEAKGGKFYKKEDLKKLTVISDVEYEILAPYINITDEYKTGMNAQLRFYPPAGKRPLPVKKKQPLEINGADSAGFVNRLGLSPWLAARIVKYRNLLGGFYTEKQLKEVYGMKAKIYRDIEPWLSVDTSKIKRIDINRAGFKEIIRHPYINYQVTKKLVNGRKAGQGFRSFEEIKRATGLPDSTLRKIKHYLYLRPLKNYRDE